MSGNTDILTHIQWLSNIALPKMRSDAHSCSSSNSRSDNKHARVFVHCIRVAHRFLHTHTHTHMLSMPWEHSKSQSLFAHSLVIDTGAVQLQQLKQQQNQQI